MRKENDGRYTGQLKIVSIEADIGIVPNTSKTADSHPDYRALTQSTEIGERRGRYPYCKVASAQA